MRKVTNIDRIQERQKWWWLVKKIFTLDPGDQDAENEVPLKAFRIVGKRGH